MLHRTISTDYELAKPNRRCHRVRPAFESTIPSPSIQHLARVIQCDRRCIAHPRLAANPMRGGSTYSAKLPTPPNHRDRPRDVQHRPHRVRSGAGSVRRVQRYGTRLRLRRTSRQWRLTGRHWRRQRHSRLGVRSATLALMRQPELSAQVGFGGEGDVARQHRTVAKAARGAKALLLAAKPNRPPSARTGQAPLPLRPFRSIQNNIHSTRGGWGAASTTTLHPTHALAPQRPSRDRYGRAYG
jgi:hypothetical protein